MLDEREEFFKERYSDFVKERNDIPSISDCVAFGFNHITFRKYLKCWEEEGKAKLIKTGYKKKVLWKGYEDYAKPPHETKNADILVVASNGGNGLLSNPFIKGYMSGVLGNPDNSELSKEAIKIMDLFGSDAVRATDKNISEKSGLPLNTARRHLTIFNENGLFSYDVVLGEEKWKTYYWHFKGLENLRNCYIFDTKKRIEELEEQIKERSAKPKYVCGKFGEEHPALDFDSDSVIDSEYRCVNCGKPLVLKTGEELIKPLEGEISILKESIEEVKKIKLNGSAEEAVKIEV